MEQNTAVKFIPDKYQYLFAIETILGYVVKDRRASTRELCVMLRECCRQSTPSRKESTARQSREKNAINCNLTY